MRLTEVGLDIFKSIFMAKKISYVCRTKAAPATKGEGRWRKLDYSAFDLWWKKTKPTKNITGAGHIRSWERPEPEKQKLLFLLICSRHIYGGPARWWLIHFIQRVHRSAFTCLADNIILLDSKTAPIRLGFLVIGAELFHCDFEAWCQFAFVAFKVLIPLYALPKYDVRRRYWCRVIELVQSAS